MQSFCRKLVEVNMADKEWTVKELMESLKQFPLEAKVFYEMGPNGTGTIGKAQYLRPVVRTTRLECCWIDRFVRMELKFRRGTLFWLHSPERKLREPEGRAGTVAPCQPEGNNRRLHAGDWSPEAGGAEQFGQVGEEECGFRRLPPSLTGSNWIMTKSGEFVEAFYFVGVPDGV
jgi:hypothetical protein